MLKTEQTLTDRRPSAVSQVLKIIQNERLRPLPKAEASARAAMENFDLRAAGDHEKRMQAFGLAYSVYQKKGYIPQSEAAMLCAPYDTRPDTLVSVARDRDGRPAGTITLVFDAPQGLPCDEIFHEELSSMRREGRWLVEVTRLAIDESHAHNKSLLALLCNIPFAFASRIRGYTDLLVEVNPRHVAFYKRLLHFTIIGDERPCPRVNGAPAVLLRANLDFYLEQMSRLRAGLSIDARRSLFPQFLGEQDERALVDALANQQRPMTIADMRMLGLERSGELRAELTARSA